MRLGFSVRQMKGLIANNSMMSGSGGSLFATHMLQSRLITARYVPAHTYDSFRCGPGAEIEGDEETDHVDLGLYQACS